MGVFSALLSLAFLPIISHYALFNKYSVIENCSLIYHLRKSRIKVSIINAFAYVFMCSIK